MIDTHTHIYSHQFDLDPQVEVVDRAVAEGVNMMLLPACDISSIPRMRALAQARPNNIRMACALHPTDLGDDWRASLSAIMDELYSHRDDYVAIGECGIDMYWDKSTVDAQMQVFDRLCEFALQHQMPLLIHCREGLDQTLEVLSGHNGVSAVFHSFGGSVSDIEHIRRLGDFYFGINGVVTFKNSGLRDVLPEIGFERLLTETDSPYLTPVPFRGKRNESAYIPYIVATMADAMNVSVEEMAAITTANALRFIPALA